MANKLIKRRYNNLLTARNNYFDAGGFWANPFKGAGGMDAKKALSAAGAAVGQIGGSLIGGGMQSGAGNVLQGLSGIASAIPGPWGAITSAGLGLLGGFTNRAIGSKMNPKNIAEVEANINSLNNFQSNASDFDMLANNWANADVGMTFSDSFIGKDGWFSNEAKNKAADLRRQIEAGNAWVQNTLNNNAENIRTTQMQDLLANYAALGGPLFFAQGGGIHIKPSKKGTFTAAATKHGMGVQEFASRVLANKDDYSPAMFGSKLNKENIARINSVNNAMNILQVDDSTNNSVADAFGTVDFGSSFTRKDVGKDGWFSNKAKNKFKVLTAQRAAAINRANATLLNAAENADTTMDQEIMANFAANGGQLKRKVNLFSTGGFLSTQGGDFFTGITEINAGGTHEENPNGGVQVGVDPEGTPNLVEEGEVIWDGYVFSNRIKVPKKVQEKYKLGTNDNLTFADAVKYAARESKERPNDPISANGLVDSMQTLQQEQETIREAMQAKELVKKMKQLPDEEKAQVLQGMTQGAEQQASEMQGTPQMEGMPMNPSMGIPESAPIMQAYGGRKANVFANGDQMNAAAAVPAVTQARRDYFINSDGGLELMPTYWEGRAAQGTMLGDQDISGKTYDDLFGTGIGRVYKDSTKRDPKDGVQYTDHYWGAADPSESELGHYPTWLRYAEPLGQLGLVLTDAFGLTNKPDTDDIDAAVNVIQTSGAYQPITFNPIGDYRRYRPLDRDYYLNKLNAEAGATRRDIMNVSGGNRGTAIAGLLSADYNAQQSIGDTLMKQELANRQHEGEVAEFNRGTNQFNASGIFEADKANQQAMQSARSIQLNAMLEGAKYKTVAKSQAAQARGLNIAGLFSSLGQIGLEAQNRKDRDMLIRHDVLRGLSPDELKDTVGKKAALAILKKRGFTEEEAKRKLGIKK